MVEAKEVVGKPGVKVGQVWRIENGDRIIDIYVTGLGGESCGLPAAKVTLKDGDGNPLKDSNGNVLEQDGCLPIGLVETFPLRQEQQ